MQKRHATTELKAKRDRLVHFLLDAIKFDHRMYVFIGSKECALCTRRVAESNHAVYPWPLLTTLSSYKIEILRLSHGPKSSTISFAFNR